MAQSSLKLKEQHLTVSEWNRILDGISQSVGAVGVNKCTPTERKRWWHETKRRTKEIRPSMMMMMTCLVNKNCNTHVENMHSVKCLALRYLCLPTITAAMVSRRL